MAGANESPRNKLIALMYLVFITMLALNVSKEVLVGFGQIFEKVTKNNESMSNSNSDYYNMISDLAVEKPDIWMAADNTAKDIRKASEEFYSFIEDIKQKSTEKARQDDPELKDYQKLDKGDALNSILFSPEGISDTGKELVDRMNNYKAIVIRVFASKYPQYINLVEDRFENGDYSDGGDYGTVTDKEGIKIPWLKYHFEGFPLISSLAKLTFIQNSIRTTENDVLNALFGRTQVATGKENADNYVTLLQTTKGAYYQGETFDGKVILGRKGGSSPPNDVDLTLDGVKLQPNQYEKIPGGISLKVSAGRPGDHQIKGNLIYMNNGEESKIPVDQSFAVIAKPNSAVISADKMNVVYRGVDNPMTISIPGIPANKVNASAPGLKKVSGSKYVMNPKKGREVKITASGTLPDGNKITTVTKYRIKDIPRPTGSVRGETGNLKIPKGNLEISTIGAILEDFDFELTLKVVSFKFKVPGQATVNVRGNKLNDKAKSALRRARSGQTVQILDIRAQNPKNPSYRFKKVAPVSIELVN